MKVKVPLLLAAMLLAIAPAAMANHCKNCSPAPATTCMTVPRFGFAVCYYDAAGCHIDLPCGNHNAPVAPLATEFTVASVERLDEPQTAAPETLVAAATTPAPATR